MRMVDVRWCGGGVWGVEGGFMRIFPWNVRGLGGFEKRREVWKLVLEKKNLLFYGY